MNQRIGCCHVATRRSIPARLVGNGCAPNTLLGIERSIPIINALCSVGNIVQTDRPIVLPCPIESTPVAWDIMLVVETIHCWQRFKANPNNHSISPLYHSTFQTLFYKRYNIQCKTVSLHDHAQVLSGTTWGYLQLSLSYSLFQTSLDKQG